MPLLPAPWRAARDNPVVWLLGGQLAMFTGIAAIFPVAPLYVRAHGGSPFDAALFVAGPLVANTLVQVPAGRWTDRVGRRPLLLGSRLIYAVLGFALFADVGPLWLLALLRVLQGAASGAYVPALRAALVDLTPEARRGERFAQLQACEMVALLVGPFLGGAAALWRTSSIFGISAVTVCIGLAAMTRVPETGGHTDHADAAPERAPWRSAGVIVPALCLAAVGTVFSMYDVVWPQYLVVRGYDSFVVGISESLFAVPILALARAGGRLSDRTNRRRLVTLAFLICGSCAASYPALRSIGPILLVGSVEAVGFVVLEPTLFAVIGDAATARNRGRAMGIGGLFQFGGSAAGAALLGGLYGLDERWAFWGGAAAMLAAAALASAALPARRHPGPRPESLPEPVLETEIT